ncbi:MAG: radical SAM protein [Gammaproteobacteria bacterium]|nr:radical SAM protein [Gammaproteobacteria bacterium]
MKIAFVSGNREQLPDAVIPIGLLYVIASIPDYHETTLIDLCFEDDPVSALRSALMEFKPDLVALGMRNIQNNAYSGMSDNLNYYAELVKIAREVAGSPIVIGGSGFSVMPRELMERLQPDFGISGEGEKAFPNLLAALENGGIGLDGIGALYRRLPDSVSRAQQPPAFLDMNELAFPDRRLVDARYYSEFGIDSVQTKRGCPLRCDYCTYPVIEGRVGRVRDAASVVDEMFRAVEEQPQINHFFIVDSVFNLPKSHAKKVCRELIDRNWQIPWSCYANPLGFDQEFAELAYAAGCAGMEIGSDSGCDHVLERLRKGFTVEHIRRLHEICASAGIPDCHTFILGTEGETINDVRHTIDFIVDLDPFSAIIMIWIDDYEALDPELRSQRIALRREIEAILLENKDKYRQWSIPALRVNFDEQLFGRLRRAGMQGPLWQHVRGPVKLRKATGR